jgi:hydrogenase expression/formation protein HypD
VIKSSSIVGDFRSPAIAESLLQAIHQEANPQRHYRFMEFCGGHTHALFRHGLTDRLPSNVLMLHGPGCPVCVLPMSRIDMAINLLHDHSVTLCTYGDMLRVPGSARNSLQTAKARGAKVEIIYSPAEVLALAAQHRDRQFVFFAIGFETTAPATALLIQAVKTQRLTNVTVFCNHVLTPPAIRGIMEPGYGAPAPDIDGLVGPGHVSVVTGLKGYEALVTRYHTGIVVAGFEPLDLLQAILLLVRQVNAGQAKVENQYRRAVRTAGNPIAQQLMDQVFQVMKRFEWRGLGFLANSALQIKPELAAFDAEVHFKMKPVTSTDNKACACPSVLRGQTRPEDCPLFNNFCTPDNPVGSCMVSTEGACAAHFHYRRHLQEPAP